MATVNKTLDHLKSIAAAGGIVVLLFQAGGAFHGKAEATELSEVKTRLSVLESQVAEVIKKLDRALASSEPPAASAS